MDSILDLERHEAKHIKDTLVQVKDLFQANAPQIFDDCFNLLLGQGAKTESFNLLKSLGDPNNAEADALNNAYNAILAICTQIIKANLKGQEEFQPILDEIGVPRAKQVEVQQVFTNSYLKKVEQLQSVYDDEQASMTQTYSKKHPLNLAVQDENLQAGNARIVDVEWRILYQLSSKNLNKVFAPRFQITLILLSAAGGDFYQGGASEMAEWSSKRDFMRVKRVQFECDHTELAHLLNKVKGACNALETHIKVAK